MKCPSLQPVECECQCWYPKCYQISLIECERLVDSDHQRATGALRYHQGDRLTNGLAPCKGRFSSAIHSSIGHPAIPPSNVQQKEGWMAHAGWLTDYFDLRTIVWTVMICVCRKGKVCVVATELMILVMRG